MSNPPSTYAPTPWFSGIIYNPTDFIENSTTAVLTYAEALKLFLQKNTPIPLLYSPNNLTSTDQLGYTVRDDYTFTGNFPNSANQVLFSTDVALPTGVWLINYYIRIISASSTTINSYNSFGNTNQLATTGQYYGAVGYPSSQTITTVLPVASSGSFVIQSGVSNNIQYNIQVYLNAIVGGTLKLETGTNKGYVIRTRIG